MEQIRVRANLLNEHRSVSADFNPDLIQLSKVLIKRESIETIFRRHFLSIERAFICVQINHFRFNQCRGLHLNQECINWIIGRVPKILQIQPVACARISTQPITVIPLHKLNYGGGTAGITDISIRKVSHQHWIQASCFHEECHSLFKVILFSLHHANNIVS